MIFQQQVKPMTSTKRRILQREIIVSILVQLTSNIPIILAQVMEERCREVYSGKSDIHIKLLKLRISNLILKWIPKWLKWLRRPSLTTWTSSNHKGSNMQSIHLTIPITIHRLSVDQKRLLTKQVAHKAEAAL